MSRSLPLKPVADATDAFVVEVLARSPIRLEAKVSSAEGMPLLCAVEAVLGRRLANGTAQELIWLNGAAGPSVHTLQLQAFGAGNVLLAEVRHEFAASA